MLTENPYSRQWASTLFFQFCGLDNGVNLTLFVGGLSVSSSAEAKGARESCPFSRLRAFVIDFSLHVCVFLSVSLPTKGIFVALSSLLRADLHFCRLVVGSFIQNQARG
jgi:hypothetical protein